MTGMTVVVRASASASLCLVAFTTGGVAAADDCVMVGQACTVGRTGRAATPAKGAPSFPLDGDGNAGGDGGSATGIELDLSGARVFRESGLTSPLDLSSRGAAGEQGSNATQGSFSKHGGDGGRGGDAGAIRAVTGADVGGLSISAANAATIVSVGGVGGAAGIGNYNGPPGRAGLGGNAGRIDAEINGGWNATQGTGLFIQSAGGQGGRGRSYAAGYSTLAPDGTNGGAGGEVRATLNALLYGRLTGASILSAGGSGGAGGDGGGGSGGSGGAGGNGGAAGNVAVTIGRAADVYSSTPLYAALLVQSQGGAGGSGGSGGSGGRAGTGGAAANVIVDIAGGSLRTQSSFSPGLLAQSLGGAGANGGSGSPWAVGSNGGAGSRGGASGNVTIKGSNFSIVTGTDGAPFSGETAPGILAQSIGGGGGNGGSASGIFSIGGSGANAVTGRDVTIDVAGSVGTFGYKSAGVAAQSIGGGGGSGGDARSSSLGIGLVIGGTAGGGGSGGAVNGSLNTGSDVVTRGNHADGIRLQSIGGGGGDGGSAYGKISSKVFGLSMSVGGSGGDGGAGGIVDYASGRDTTNAGSIETFGADAFGILGQSIGGGGGAGGSSIAIAETSGFRDFPTLSIAFAVGGSGGKGGRGNAVRLGNTGTIVTGGSGAIGIAGQSIGGGGGVAGDASAQASSSGKSVNLSASIAVGGRGKAAGEGGAVTIENLGDIATAGADADGLLAQSIGGGGGSGGFGDGTSESSDGKLNVALTMAIGGDGGGGGSGGPVIANNGGRISTQGAGANGITAQTVGGGGGRAGGGAGSASGDYSLSLNVGGLAGSGGGTFGTGTMRVDNTGLIETAGGDAAGILAQSIGGGGGVGGKAAGASLQSQTSIRGEPSSAINLVLAVGGKGGTGGAAGAITVTNTGELRTRGALADGIVAQAIGGGGGKGGASNPAQSAKDTGQLVVGGTGGAGGNGGQPIVLNQGAISTAGPLAAGIITQSISGGGGVGGLSASTAGVGTAASTLFNSASLSVGGSGAASGTSGQAIVENTGYIETSGHDSPGIIAQSIAGGGGIVKLMSTSLETEANSGVAKEFDANIRFGGPAATNGASGLVRVTTRSGADIRTSGDNSFGIVAQTIAGGGGLFLGGTPTVRPSKDYFGVGKMTGSVIDDMERNSGNSGLWIETGGNIITTGQGAAAILAQSIGGGGGLAGDSGATEQLLPFQASVNHDGSGGAIDIKVGPASIIATSGTNAPALILQSIGGGGGRVVTKSGVFSGTAGGTGRGGAINVLVDGKVSANGPASRGIFAQSVGDRTSSSPITIIVGSTGSISGGPLVNGSGDPTAAIYLDHGGMTVSSPNRVANRGKITSLGAARGTAIFGDYGTTIVTNSGVIVGSVNLSNNGGSGSLENTGIIEASTIRLGGGSFENAGRWIVDASRGPVILGGDYVGKATGQIVVAADLESSEPAIEVAGRAILFGGLKIEPSSLRNKSVVLINAAGGITTNSPVQIEPTKLYTFTAENTGNALVVTPHAHFQQATAGLDANEMALAEALQTMWDDGVDASSLFTALASIDETSSYEQSLAALSGGAVESVATFQFANARVFLNNLEVGCGDAGEADACSWGRIVDSDSSQTGDSGFRQRGWAMQFGTEAAIGEDWTLSSGLSYDENHFTGNQSFTQIRGSSARLGLAIGYSPSEWSFQAALASGIGRYRSLRTIAVGDVAGEADGRLTQFQLAARLSVSNDISLGVAYLRPGLSIGVLGLHTPFHREHSLQKLGLSFASDTHVVALLDPSLEMGAKISVGQEHVLRLFGNVGAQFASQSEWVSRANFAVEDGSSFRVASPVADVIARARLGFVLETRKARFSLEYAQDGGSGYRSKSLAIRAAVNF